jgi:methionine aminotransferase
MSIHFESKLPKTATTIFTVMSALAHEHQAVNLSQGFPDYPADPVLKDLVCRSIQEDYNQYAPMAGVPALLIQISKKIENSYGWAPDPGKEITVTTGASQAICSAISMMISPGDEAIIIEPAYDSYAPAVIMNGGKTSVYEMLAPDFKVDWQAIRNLITNKTKLLIINNPHNPTGSIFDENDLDEVEKIVQETGVYLLSDEVYEHLVFDGKIHQSILTRPGLKERGMAVFSFGKSLHATGWKIGYLIANPFLSAEFRKIHQFTVFSVNSPAQHGISAYLAGNIDWSKLSGFFQQKRDLLQAGLQNSRFDALNSAGTYFQLYDYSGISMLPDHEFAKWLTIEHGVATIPLSPFYTSGLDQKLIRICFAKKEETIQNAVGRLVEA